MVLVYSSFHNEWGDGRMVLVPWLDTQGRRYIVGASIQLDELKMLTRQAVAVSFIVSLLLFGLVWLFSSLLVKRVANQLTRFSKAIREMEPDQEDIVLPGSGLRNCRS